MFDTERFIADCCAAGVSSGLCGVLEVVSRAVSAPAEILDALGSPRRAGVQVLYRSTALTVFNLIWDRRCANYPMIIGCGL